jgi:hypothetical protein
MILFLNLGEIASIAAIIVLLIQGFTHTGHLFHIKKTGASKILVSLAIFGTFSAAGFAIYYTAKTIPHFELYILIAFILAFLLEVALRAITKRTIEKQIK